MSKEKFIPEIEAQSEMIEIKLELEKIREGNAENISSLVKTLSESLSIISEKNTDAVFYDKDLGKTISDSLASAIKELSQMNKPASIDLKPISLVVDEVSRQNKGVIDLLNRMSMQALDKTEYTNLYRLVIDMVKSNNEFIKSAIRGYDYSDHLKSISESVRRDPLSYVFKVTKRDAAFRLQEGTITPVFNINNVNKL